MKAEIQRKACKCIRYHAVPWLILRTLLGNIQWPVTKLFTRSPSLTGSSRSPPPPIRPPSQVRPLVCTVTQPLESWCAALSWEY